MVSSLIQSVGSVAPTENRRSSEQDIQKLALIRHTCAHIMAMAVQKLYPGTKVAIGPVTETGFFYDFDSPVTFTRDHFPKIIKEMRRIIKANLPIVREVVSKDDIKSEIVNVGEPYKLEILDSIPDGETITRYFIGSPDSGKLPKADVPIAPSLLSPITIHPKSAWWDLCAGPHVNSTGEIDPNSFALESLAGAYWRGDETKPMLQRIYGTAWETPEQLAAYLTQKEEALKRDHRKLGQELKLFSIQEDAGGGLVFWHPRGAKIRYIIEDYWRKAHLDADYELLYTPHIANLDLWKTSGHFDFYQESMFDSMDVDERAYQIKPMNCPFHVLTYKHELHSYRELPLRWAELGTVYRYERSGALHGLMRVRGFTQDDAHVFCLPDQIAAEILRVLDLTEHILSDFGFHDYEINLSTRPEKSVGEDEVWELATSALIEALNAKGWNYSIDEGGGAFYGPKIDLKIKDAIGRLWQCSTIQVDFNLPERFEMEYVATDNTRKRPIMIHRAIFGSLERFFGILIENYAGNFPLWLAPIQLRLLPVTEEVREYCDRVITTLKQAGFRVELDNSHERLGKMIRTAELEKIPVVGVIGMKEMETQTLSIRTRKGGDLGVLNLEDLQQKMQQTIENKGSL